MDTATLLSTTPTSAEATPPRRRTAPPKRDVRPLTWKDGHEVYPTLYPFASSTDMVTGRCGAFFARGNAREWKLEWRPDGDRSGTWRLMVRGTKDAAEPWNGAWIGAVHFDHAVELFERARAMPCDLVVALERVRGECDQRDALQEMLTAFANPDERICPKGHLYDATARALRNVAKHLLRMGWSVTGAGDVVQTWRERCSGRWVHASTVFPYAERRDTHWVRVEGGLVLEIVQGDTNDFRAEVDGKACGELPDLDDAKDLALRHARRAQRSKPPAPVAASA